MPIIRFLLGTGVWIFWYLAFWFVVLVSVVMILIMFRGELKQSGEKPATPSPASFMVVMIATGLGFLTLVDGLLFARVVAMPGWLKIVAPIVVAIGVCVSLFPVNILLATHQSHPMFWLNLALSLELIGVNLTMLHFARTHASGAMSPNDVIPLSVSIVLPIVISTVVGIKVPEDPSPKQQTTSQ